MRKRARKTVSFGGRRTHRLRLAHLEAIHAIARSIRTSRLVATQDFFPHQDCPDVIDQIGLRRSFKRVGEGEQIATKRVRHDSSHILGGVVGCDNAEAGALNASNPLALLLSMALD